ncbi:MAG: hypothetical protein ABIJ30_04650 [bacterium]
MSEFQFIKPNDKRSAVSYQQKAKDHKIKANEVGDEYSPLQSLRLPVAERGFL